MTWNIILSLIQKIGPFKAKNLHINRFIISSTFFTFHIVLLLYFLSSLATHMKSWHAWNKIGTDSQRLRGCKALHDPLSISSLSYPASIIFILYLIPKHINTGLTWESVRRAFWDGELPICGARRFECKHMSLRFPHHLHFLDSKARAKTCLFSDRLPPRVLMYLVVVPGSLHWPRRPANGHRRWRWAYKRYW